MILNLGLICKQKRGCDLKEGLKDKSCDYYFDKKENVSGSVATRHYHSFFELYYMREGKCNYFIGDRSYDVVSGDIILVPCDTIHRTNYTSRSHSRLLLNFPESFISPAILEEAKALGYLYRNRAISHQVESIFAMIEQEYMRNDSLSPHALRAYTEELLVLMLRHGGSGNRKISGNSVVEDTIKYIQQNYMADIRLTSAAKHISVSPEHLSRTFKQKTSFGFNEYLTLYRLQRAEQILLNEPGRSIIDVAYACGFNDSNYFSYKFKEHYGISPSKIRGGAKPNNRTNSLNLPENAN